MIAHSPEELRHGYLCALVVILIWTGFILVSRLGGKSALTPYDVIALRYAVAAPAILLLWLRHRSNIFEWRKLVLALAGGLGFTLFAFNGFRHAPANHAAVLLQGFLPFSVAVMAYFIMAEKPTSQRLFGLGFVALGVGCIATDSFSSSGLTELGDGLLICASLCWALYTVLLRHWRLPPMDSTIAVTLLTAIIYLPIYLLFLPKHYGETGMEQIALFGVYQGIIVAIVQMIFYTKSVDLLGATRLSMVTSCVPVLGALGGVLLLNEALTPLICLGLLFVVTGAWVGNRQKKTTKSITLAA